MQPNSAEMLELRSEVYLRHARYDDALSVADQILQRDADNASALTLKALALLRLGRRAEALPLGAIFPGTTGSKKPGRSAGLPP